MTVVSMFVVAGLAGLALLVYWWRTAGWLPAELREGDLVHVERTLKAEMPFPVVGRPDRVYRLPGGEHTPLEYKTRDVARLYESDRAQISLQAWLLRKNGHPTAPHGWVVVRRRKDGARYPLKVDLGDDAYCERLVRRYVALRAGRVIPQKTLDGRCKSCGHREACH